MSVSAPKAEQLRAIARRIEAQPWNRAGTDKRWVLEFLAPRERAAVKAALDRGRGRLADPAPTTSGLAPSRALVDRFVAACTARDLVARRAGPAAAGG